MHAHTFGICRLAKLSGLLFSPPPLVEEIREKVEEGFQKKTRIWINQRAGGQKSQQVQGDMRKHTLTRLRTHTHYRCTHAAIKPGGQAIQSSASSSACQSLC